MVPLMQSADVGDVLLFAGRRLSRSSVVSGNVVVIWQGGAHSDGVDGARGDGAGDGG